MKDRPDVRRRMRTVLVVTAAVLAVVALFVNCGGIRYVQRLKTRLIAKQMQKTKKVGTPIRQEDPPVYESTTEWLKGRYEPLTIEAGSGAAQYELPVDLAKIANPSFVQRFPPLGGNPALRELLSKNGFVVTPEQRHDDVAEFYKQAMMRNYPIFITSDSLLHLYHVQFGETLKNIEEGVFFSDILSITKRIQRQAQSLTNSPSRELTQAAILLVRYSTVALHVLRKQNPPLNDDTVRAEVSLIRSHRGFEKSPTFHYIEDYSQYVPRGHYTRSAKLKRYFTAMMWYGRMTFMLRRLPNMSDQDPVLQTRAAFMLAKMMDLKLEDGRTIGAVWSRIYTVTAFYVGYADDLTLNDYREALRGLAEEAESIEALASPALISRAREQLGKMRKPRIHGGQGGVEGPVAGKDTSDALSKIQKGTQGLRLMGQRYIPDGYIMQSLVYPCVGAFSGQGSPFTLVQTHGGPIRGVPRALDIMAVLGSDRAVHWIEELGDDDYPKYDEKLLSLRKEFNAMGQPEWNRNMYWAWLYALRPLLMSYSPKHPTFMQSAAWQDKQLSASMASWSQLRHDTILYAKQPYTPMPSIGLGSGQSSPEPKPPMVEGYVEPVPEFYARLLGLTRMTIKGLQDFRLLPAGAAGRLGALERILLRLLDLSQRELANERLSQDDYAFIRSFGKSVTRVVVGMENRGIKTTTIADVHTDSSSKQALEEGTGYLHWLVAVYPMPDGGIVAGVGPVFTHYEFKHPMADRLTDEKWKAMLKTGRHVPLPEWTSTFRRGPTK